MSIQERRERERAERERLIIAAARKLAEAEGWDAVTTRRLAAEIDYSQPVLYSHFSGKNAIMTAVAVEGFVDLAAALRAARDAADGPGQALVGVAEAYADFAQRQPALYEAMFASPVDVPFASPESPAPLREAFAELSEAVTPFAGDDEPGTLAETLWSGLHGLLTLLRDGRVRAEEHEARLSLLLRRLAQ